MSSKAPSGAQWTVSHGEHEATVVEVGGGIRSYAHGGRDVVVGYGPGEQCTAGRGQLLMPWPNRIGDGKYSFGGRTLQLALSEPARLNASHGLVRWSLWTVLEQSADRLRVGCRLLPQQGWAWFLDLDVTYALGDDGLTVTPRATNVGEEPAPFGFGAHPYLTAGETRLDDLDLSLPGRTRLLVDDERLLPTGMADVAGTELDLRAARALGELSLDTAYTDLETGDDGRWRARITNRADRRTVTLWADAAAYPWVQAFTGDSLPAGQARTTGLAIEPMTCPPDAFRTGTDLVVIQPGSSWQGSWGITPSADGTGEGGWRAAGVPERHTAPR